MNNQEKADVAQLEAMSIDQARRAIASGTFGGIGSERYAFCFSWLAAKEASVRENREEESLRIARRANKLARSNDIECNYSYWGRSIPVVVSSKITHAFKAILGHS